VDGVPSRLHRITTRVRSVDRPLGELAAVWGLTIAISLLFAHVTAVGPTLLALTRTHGVHLGDLVFACAACAVAALISVRLVRRGR
jgi:hypothetical protein